MNVDSSCHTRENFSPNKTKKKNKTDKKRIWKLRGSCHDKRSWWVGYSSLVWCYLTRHGSILVNNKSRCKNQTSKTNILPWTKSNTQRNKVVTWNELFIRKGRGRQMGGIETTSSSSSSSFFSTFTDKSYLLSLIHHYPHWASSLILQ